jgi:hypothetical protein
MINTAAVPIMGNWFFGWQRTVVEDFQAKGLQVHPDVVI